MRQHPVVLLTVDSLRDDTLTAECFPDSFSLFETDFSIYTNAFSHGIATPFAFPGIISASHVVGDKQMGSSVWTLAERLADWQSVGFSNNGLLSEERGYHRGFDSFHDLKPPDRITLFDRLKESERLRNSRVASFMYRSMLTVRQQLTESSGVDDPFPSRDWGAPAVVEFVKRQLRETPDSFVWAHFMDPHTPYHPDKAPDLDVAYSRAELADIHDRFHKKNADLLSDDKMAALRELYESNVRYFDTALADLLEWCRDQPWYDEALILIASDHGDLFGEYGRTFHPWDADPWDELVHVPLLVKYPDGEHARKTFDHLVQHRDIAATIIDTLGIEDATIPDNTHPLSDPVDRHVISKSNTALRLTEPSGRLVVRRDGSTDREGTLSDEGEQQLEAATYPNCRDARDVVIGIGEIERQQQLEELGYLQS
jgi:arylsulfatase A-like enzyme